ncbi:hypothetical protein DVH24_006308 [Malus domestica]|uniref:Uncharacterized protein n=1 Tax=Malus domestica TaxID=3750 RepID=A0A498KCA5_MALDO|nr:hypothetical protein DVH24_006308 [Malus domestica]
MRSGDLSAITTDPRFHEWERGQQSKKSMGTHHCAQTLSLDVEVSPPLTQSSDSCLFMVGQGVGPWMCSASSIMCLHVLIHKISTICILDFLLFGLVLILSAILTPHSLSLTQFKALPTFSHKLLKHSSSQTSQIPHSVQKYLGNYNQMMNLRFTWFMLLRVNCSYGP